VLDGLDADAEAFIIWAWQHRHKLLQLFWNHHTFERGKRAGSSPLELAEVLDQLFCQSVAAQAAWFFQGAKSVNLFRDCSIIGKIADGGASPQDLSFPRPVSGARSLSQVGFCHSSGAFRDGYQISNSHPISDRN
jgi:hypothetical protein